MRSQGLHRDDVVAQALRRRGGKVMQAPSLPWAAHALESALRPEWPGLEAVAVEHSLSTNTDLLDAARAGRLNPAVLLAERQTAGRGRHGRVWHSQPGDSLTFSIGLCLRPAQGWGALSLVVGHAVAQVLQPQGSGDSGCLMLKWPNDLWWYDLPPRSPAERAAGQKVGGILIETLSLLDSDASNRGRRWVVIGIGLNVRPVALPSQESVEGEPACLPASVSRWRPQVRAPALWHELVPAVLRDVRTFEQEGFEPFSAAVHRRELLIGQPVSWRAGARHDGVCIGIDRDGALRVRDESGEQRVMAGDVRVRLLNVR